MHRLFEFAMKIEIIDFQQNPMKSVEIRGFSTRVRKKQVLSPEQFQALMQAADLRLQVMMALSCSLGLRPSELLALQWRDFDLDRGRLLVSRSITGSHVAATKTEDSEDETFLDSKILVLVLRWKDQCPETPEQWLFPNIDTKKPFHADSLRQDYLRPLGQRIGITNLGWYAFRHTYRALLDDLGTPVGVQQKLMRHSDVRTTMNVYGSAYEQSKRQANERVAGKLLGSQQVPALQELIQ